MRIRRLAIALAAGIAVMALIPAARADILIRVDKAAQLMTVTVDGEPRYTWQVSTGMADYDTPSGDFQAFRMERDHFSREWDDAPMPYSIFFTREGHAIHGSFDVKHLGRPASHGCVRLSKEHAAVLWDLVEAQGLKATHVVLTGEIPGGDSRVVARRAPAMTLDNDDEAPPRQRVYNARGWREYREAPRYQDAPRYRYGQRYYDDGYQPYTPPRRYGRGIFPFGW
jgi:L,D-transpeptidase catalytic domain